DRVARSWDELQARLPSSRGAGFFVLKRPIKLPSVDEAANGVARSAEPLHWRRRRLRSPTMTIIDIPGMCEADYQVVDLHQPTSTEVPDGGSCFHARVLEHR